MKIGEMARRAGVSPKAVRRYEQLGLIAPRRESNGYRAFDERDLQTVRELRTLRQLGISAERSRPFLDCLAAGAAASDECPSSMAEYATAIDELTAHITELTDRRSALLTRLKTAAYRNSVACPGTSQAPDTWPAGAAAAPDTLSPIESLDYLVGRRLPGLAFPATSDESIRIDELGPGRTVLYLYPLTGRPDRDLPQGWKTIPGASGCTPQACGFRDHHRELLDAGAAGVYGLSSQDGDYQREVAARLGLPFAMLSDSGFALAAALGLPTFDVAGTRLYRRATLIVRGRMIEHVFHPIPEPAQHAEHVLDWLRSR